MTAIAYRDGVLAADTTSWCDAGHCMVIASTRPKIQRCGDKIAACAGSRSLILLFEQWWFGAALPSEKPDDFDDFGAIAAIGQNVWSFDHRLVAMEIDAPYAVIGAGAGFMRGALAAGATAEQAVRLAIQHTDAAAGEVQVERLLPGRSQ